MCLAHDYESMQFSTFLNTHRVGMASLNLESRSTVSTIWLTFDLAPSPSVHTRIASIAPHVYATPSMWFVVLTCTTREQPKHTGGGHHGERQRPRITFLFPADGKVAALL